MLLFLAGYLAIGIVVFLVGSYLGWFGSWPSAGDAVTMAVLWSVYFLGWAMAAIGTAIALAGKRRRARKSAKEGK